MSTSAPATEQASIDIDVSPQIAYAAMADVTRMCEWSPETYRVSWKQPGRTFRGWNRNGRFRWFTDGTVIEATPGVAFVFDISLVGLPIARWGYAFAPVEGGTRVTETWDDRRGEGAFGAVVKRLGRLTTGTAHDTTDTPANLRATLEQLKSVLEAGR